MHFPPLYCLHLQPVPYTNSKENNFETLLGKALQRMSARGQVTQDNLVSWQRFASCLFSIWLHLSTCPLLLGLQDVWFPKTSEIFYTVEAIKRLPRSNLIRSGIPKLGIKSFRMCFATFLALQVLQVHAIGQLEKLSMATSWYLNPFFHGNSAKFICHTCPNASQVGTGA